MSGRRPGDEGPSPTRPRVVVTQGEGAQGSLAAALGALGAEVVALPAIAIEPARDPAPLDAALGALDGFDWIVFTSRHAVDAVCARPAWLGAREQRLPGLRIAAVGRATARSLQDQGVVVDVFPEEAGGAALAGAMIAARPLAGARVLWPRSEIALRELPEALARAGASLVEPVAYRTVVPEGGAAAEIVAALDEGRIDAVAFLSPSSARNLPALMGRPDLAWLARRAGIASIGPSTSVALRELGAPPDVESSRRTAEDLADVLVSWIASRPETGRRSAS